MSGEMKGSMGRLYPFSYKRFQEPDEALADLLRSYHRVVWLLDIRFNPESDAVWPQYRGEWLKQEREHQYRHARGLGLLDGQLYRPESAIRKILQLLQQDESFVLFSDDWMHVTMVERLIRSRAKEQQVALEDPYVVGPGDLCFLREASTEVVVCTRQIDVYRFYTESLDPNVCSAHGLVIEGYTDLRELRLQEKTIYLCVECGRGGRDVRFREKPGKRLCGHCFWLWDLKYGEV